MVMVEYIITNITLYAQFDTVGAPHFRRKCCGLPAPQVRIIDNRYYYPARA